MESNVVKPLTSSIEVKNEDDSLVRIDYPMSGEPIEPATQRVLNEEEYHEVADFANT